MGHHWNQFVRQQPNAHFLQLAEWGTLKAAFGWQTETAAIQDDTGAMIAGAQLLFRPLPLHLGTLAYLPMGPYIAESTQAEAHTELWQAIHTTARKHNAAFLKWEPGIMDTVPDFDALGFQPSPQTIQPPNTILLDLTADEDAIMARMNQGTRRKIRQGYKKDVMYYHGTRADIAKFNQIMQTTGDRNEFGVHEPRYYEMAYDLFIEQGDGTLILAEHEGDILAGIMVFALGDTAWYPYGASSSVKRNLMATYGVQWEAIRWAKARGCKQYDLWGIPDADEETLEAQFQERDDGLWGVYGFKRGWGGDVVRSLGAWDKVYNPLVYHAYKLALKARG